MSYSSVKKCAVIFLLIYFTTGVLARLLTRGNEDFYPFFSWFLFSDVPPRIQYGYAVRMDQIGDEKFSPPVFFEKTPAFAKKSVSSGEFYNLTQLFGQSIAHHQTDETDRLRKRIEQNLPPRSVYEIVGVEYDVIKHFDTGEVTKVDILGTFRTNP